MSKIKLTGHASGSGILTIAAPNTDSDRTITLPDVTGTLLDSGSDLPAANLTGTVADARISTLTASKLTGDLPAISGANLTGISSVGGATGVDFNDNTKARFGTGNDLEIYHDGSNSFITEASGTGELYIRATNLILKSGADNDDYIKCHENGDVKLYYSNAEKLATTSTGVTVSGALTATAGSGAMLKVNEGGGSYAYLEAGGSTSYLEWKDGHSFTLRKDDNANYMVFNDNHTIDNYGSNGNWQRMMYAGGTGTQYYHSFRLSNNTQVGYINTNGSSTSYNTSSDYRLKENVNYDWDATTRLKQLKPARFNWIADETNTLVDGFIAHEVEDIVPEAVSGEKDAMEAAVLYKEGDALPEGKEVGDVKFAEQISPQSIDQAKLVPLLVKTIQELEARITTLEG